MSYEVKLRDRVAHVELLNRQGDQLLIAVDGREYALDFVRLNKGSYSIIHNHKSYNVELIPTNGIKKYNVNTFKNSYEVEIIDAEAKYKANRLKGQEDESTAAIIAPIPGKVVKILVEEGESIEAGQTVIVIAAMKMESEFKAAKAGIVSSIKVKEGQSVEAKQELVVIEYEE